MSAMIKFNIHTFPDSILAIISADVIGRGDEVALIPFRPYAMA